MELIRLWPAWQVLEREEKGFFRRGPLAFLSRFKPHFPCLLWRILMREQPSVCAWAAADKQSLLFSVRKTTNLAFMSCTVLAPDIGPGVTT